MTPGQSSGAWGKAQFKDPPMWMCVDLSVLQRFWDFQRDEQPGDEVNKMGARFCTGAVIRVRCQAPGAALSSHFNLPFLYVPTFGRTVRIPVRGVAVLRKQTPVRPSPGTFLT